MRTHINTNNKRKEASLVLFTFDCFTLTALKKIFNEVVSRMKDMFVVGFHCILLQFGCVKCALGYIFTHVILTGYTDPIPDKIAIIV